MRILPLLFWAATIGCIWWCGRVFIDGSIGATYHPMATLGDHFSEVRTKAIAIPIVVALIMAILWFWRRPLKPVFYLFGSAPVAVAFAMTFLPKFDSGYEQVYWLENQMHRIPWVFGPFNSDQQRGGKYFLVRTWGNELAPYYDFSEGRPSDYFVLAKSTAFNYGKGGTPPEDNCVAKEFRFKCQWQSDDYFYAMSIRAESAPESPESLFKPVELLMDSFEVIGQ